MTHMQWPLLNQCKELGMIDELDITLAKALLEKETEKREDWAFFLCHMLRAFREGSLAVSVKGGSINPSPHSLWKAGDAPVLKSLSIDLVERSILSGASLPSSLVQRGPSDGPESKPVICEGDRFYFRRALHAEETFLKSLKNFISKPKRSKIDEKKALLFAQLQSQKGLLETSQAKALVAFLEAPITLIMGGPGTGKTYTAAMIVRMIQSAVLPGEQYKIALAAPTGKAASNLKQALVKCGAGEELEEPKTLHALLNLRFRSKEVKTPFLLSHDLFIIDEASMIDIELMTALFNSMKPTSKVIFLGDKNQLPPIDLGSPFSDMAEEREILPKEIQCVELDVSIRCENSAILEFSRLILGGEKERIEKFLNNPGDGIEWIQRESKSDKELFSQIVEKAVEKYAPLLKSGHTDQELLSLKTSFSILTPFRIGIFGSDSINRAVASRITAHKETAILPVMILENRPELSLYNGDTGLLLTDREGIKEAIFPGQDSGKIKRIPEAVLPKYDLAFALSIHKSQGSEYEEALIILPEGTEHFGKKIAYTALTRVKKRASIMADLNTICKTASEKTPRTSGIPLKLSDIQDFKKDGLPSI